MAVHFTMLSVKGVATVFVLFVVIVAQSVAELRDARKTQKTRNAIQYEKLTESCKTLPEAVVPAVKKFVDIFTLFSEVMYPGSSFFDPESRSFLNNTNSNSSDWKAYPAYGKLCENFKSLPEVLLPVITQMYTSVTRFIPVAVHAIEEEQIRQGESMHF